jgi:hypothetical protein
MAAIALCIRDRRSRGGLNLKSEPQCPSLEAFAHLLPERELRPCPDYGLRALSRSL